MNRIAAILFLCTPAAAFGQLEAEAPPELVETLTERVHAFYQAFELGQFRQGEAFVDAESQDLYYNVRKVRIMGHEIKNISWGEDFRSARVMATALTIVPMAGTKPVPMPVGSEWNLIDGEWYMHLSAPKDPSQTPFGRSNADAGSGATGIGGVPQQQGSAPTVATFQRMISLAEYSTTFPVETTEPVTREIQIHSKAPEGLDLTMELTRRAPDGLTVSIEPTKIASGDSSVIRVTYDSSAGRFTGERSLNFVVEPTGQRVQLKLEFEESSQATSPPQQ